MGRIEIYEGDTGMAYKIEKEGEKYLLAEVGFSTIKLGLYDTQEEAETSKAEWIARDELSDDISDFIHDMLEKYEGRLTDDEIRAMVKEY